MPRPEAARAASASIERSIVRCASVALVGLILSGPIGIAIAGIHPQPAWSGPAAFVRAYHPLQAAPYFAGFLLVGGMVGLVAALAASAREELRVRAYTALALAGAFAALVFLNYTLQTTFVPALARTWSPENGPLVAALSLSNPTSLGWALEMWGYAVLGASTWLVAPVVRSSNASGRLAAALFVANGTVSVVGGLSTALRPGWVMSGAGLALFAGWNLLMAVMLASTIVAFHGRRWVVRPHLPTAP